MSKRQLRALAVPAVLALLGAAAAATACATTENQAPVDQPPVVILEAGTTPDAADADAGPEAGIVMPSEPCTDAGLCIVPAPIDTQINVTAVWGSGPNDVWGVGTNRTIVHYDGKVWEKAAPFADEASPFTMRSVWLGGPGDVWVTAGPQIYHSTGWNGPAGTEWKTATETGGSSFTAVRGMGGTVLIARQVLNDFWGASPSVVACSGWSGDGLVDGAFVDTPMFAADGADGLWSLAMTRADEAWATSVGTDDRPGARVVRIYRGVADGDDPGAEASWQVEEHDSRTSRNLHGVWGNEEVVWLVGEGGVLRRMTRAKVAGHAFETVPSPVTADLRGVHGFGANDVWAVGDDATVVHYDGNAWTRVATPFDTVSMKPRLFAVWGSSPKDVWIGGNGVMLHFVGNAP